MKNNTRRDFVKKAVLAGGLLPFYGFPFNSSDQHNIESELSVNVFSKNLQFLDYSATGEMAAELGFSGVDLTVRQGGHVSPENVASKLPKAISEIRNSGSACNIITTKVEDVKNPADVKVLETAASLNIEYYRMNWYKYPSDIPMNKSLQQYAEQIKELGELNKKLGLIGCYQNHSGRNVGASFWEINKILELANPDFFGVQYDIRHAMVEGGRSWENGLQLLHNRIKVIVLKDYKWGLVDGKWEIMNTPIGEGMVDFNKYFKLLKEYNLKPPVSLHLEYPLGGAEHGSRELTIDKGIVFKAMKTDLERVQQLWMEA